MQTFCEECACWERTLGCIGECKRRAPTGLDEDGCGVWPLTADNSHCWDGIAREAEDDEHV